jgi:hypothetical protein
MPSTTTIELGGTTECMQGPADVGHAVGPVPDPDPQPAGPQAPRR